MKVISIVIATYNAGKTLNRCIDSIITQKTDEIELLIIDGKSSDDTIKIVESYGEKVDYLISEKDKGIYDAWNKAIKVAQGKWIMFLGADDMLLDNCINDYLSFLENGNHNLCDIISAKCLYCDENGKIINKNPNFKYDFDVFKYYMNISHGSTLHNKNLFKELGLFDISYKCSADYDFLMRRRLKSEFIDKYMIVMQMGGTSFSLRGVKETFNIKRKYKYCSFMTDLYYSFKDILSIIYNSFLLKLCKF